jgi:hypothetical protein
MHTLSTCAVYLNCAVTVHSLSRAQACGYLRDGAWRACHMALFVWGACVVEKGIFVLPSQQLLDRL